MMHAAANMMAHDGEMLARYTPTGDVHAPAKPAARPNLGMHVLFLMCVMNPPIEVGIMVNIDVAVDAIASIPKPRRKIGIIMVPPPMPNRPEKIPIKNPTIAAMMNTSTAVPYLFLWCFSRATYSLSAMFS